jgi:hypothetical protein
LARRQAGLDRFQARAVAFAGRLSGDLEWPDGETDTGSEASQHVDQRVGAEQVDAASEDIADPGLRHAEDLGRLPL